MLPRCCIRPNCASALSICPDDVTSGTVSLSLSLSLTHSRVRPISTCVHHSDISSCLFPNTTPRWHKSVCTCAECAFVSHSDQMEVEQTVALSRFHQRPDQSLHAYPMTHSTKHGGCPFTRAGSEFQRPVRDKRDKHSHTLAESKPPGRLKSPQRSFNKKTQDSQDVSPCPDSRFAPPWTCTGDPFFSLQCLELAQPSRNTESALHFANRLRQRCTSQRHCRVRT